MMMTMCRSGEECRQRLPLLILLYVVVCMLVECANAQEVEGAFWSYQDDSVYGPNSWAVIESTLVSSTPAFPYCSRQRQSPVNFHALTPTQGLQPLNPSWPASANATVEHIAGRTVRLWLNDVQSRIRDPISGGEYMFTHGDLRSVSEHTFGGSHRDLELQLVHVRHGATASSALPETLIVAVTFVSSEFGRSDFLEQLLVAVGGPGTNNSVPTTRLELAHAFPVARDYVAYDGTLTYPPCTGGVRWIIAEAPSVVSTSQVRSLREALGFTPSTLGNVRPTQQEVTASEAWRYVDSGNVEQACTILKDGKEAIEEECKAIAGRRMGLSVSALVLGVIGLVLGIVAVLATLKVESIAT